MEYQENRNRSNVNEIRKSMRQAGVFFFLLMLIEIPVGIIIGIVQYQFPVEKGTLISVLITQGYLLLAAIIYIIVTGKRLKVDLEIKSYKLSSFFLSLVVLIAAAPMSICLNLISQLFVKNETSMAIYEITENVPAWAAILIIGCLPGIVEETLYRGIMLHAFRRYSILVGVLVSAVSFGLMHLNFNQIPYAIYLGLIFAFIVEATGSLLSTMIMHAIFNAVNTAYLFILPKLMDYLETVGQGTGQSMEELLNAEPTKAEIINSLFFWTPGAIIGIGFVILLIRKIAELNGRTLTWNMICSRNGLNDEMGDVAEQIKGYQVRADGTVENLYGDYDSQLPREVFADKNTKDVKPLNIWIILGWVFCLVMAVLSM